MHITIKKEIFYEMLFHCLEQNPLEARGILAGPGETIERMHKTASLKDSTKAVDAAESFRAAAEIRKAGHKTLAIFRAHADTDRPTQLEIDSSTGPDVALFIVNLPREGLPTVRAFRIERRVADEIHIEIE